MTCLHGPVDRPKLKLVKPTSVKRYPWRLFTGIQVAGVLCAAILPEAVGDLIPPFLSLLAGLLLLLPGSVVALVLTPLLYPIEPNPRAELILPVLAAMILNVGVFAAFAKTNWRPKLAFNFRVWLLIAGLGNAIALVFMCLWFPSAGRNGYFDRPHVQQVAAAALLTVFAMIVIAASLLLRRGSQPSSWIIVGVQFLRLLPATQAMETWPGGDDGPGMGWAGIVIPFTWILALVGAVTCVWCSFRAARE